VELLLSILWGQTAKEAKEVGRICFEYLLNKVMLEKELLPSALCLNYHIVANSNACY
jgi:hypothetical protein